MNSLIDILAASCPTFLWCYNGCMKIVNFPTQGYNQVGASGQCPHCLHASYLRPVTGAHVEHIPGSHHIICNAAQCESCKEYVLVLGERYPSGETEYRLKAVYPLGKPNDSVDPTVPKQIAADFKEALRCSWIDAHKATVAMCRRAVQASAIEKGASAKERLVSQIDELAGKGTITESLRKMAHEVRLTGNVGAHPDEDGLEDVTPEDANDIIEFTREFFHHVYVMPATLEARRKKPEAKGPEGAG